MKPKRKTNTQTHKAGTSKQGTDPNSYLVSLLNSISDALVATDLDFNILEWNPVAEELYGWKNAEVLGRPLREFIQNQYGNTTQENVIENVLEGGIWRGEITQNRKDGSRFPVLVSISLVRNETDQPVGFIAIHRDISEPKRVESQLRESEERFSKAFHSTPTALILARLSDRRIEYVSDSFLELVGRQREEVIGQILEELTPFPNPEQIKKFREALAETKQIRNLETAIRTKSGDIKDVLFSVDIIQLGEQPSMLTTLVDITQRKQAERQVIQMKRLYATLSQVNQTIVRVKSQAELYQSICDVALKFGELTFAWIGLLDEETGDIQPAAVSGMNVEIEKWPFPIMNIHRKPSLNGVITEAMHTSNTVTSEDVQTDERMTALQDVVRKFGFHSLAAVPFRLRGITTGILVMISVERGVFNAQEELKLLDEMGLDISFALDTMELEKERRQARKKIEQQNQRLLVLREIDTAILSADSIESIVGAALDHIRVLLDCERANLALIEWEKNEAVNFDVRDSKDSAISNGARVSLDLIQDILQVLSKNQPVIMDDLTTLPDPPLQIKIFIKEGLRSRCILPVFSQGNLIGSFTLSSKIPGYFNEEKIELGREVANQVAIAISQSRLVASLRTSEEKYSVIFDQSPFALSLTKMPEVTIVGVNDAFMELFEFTRAEAIGKTSAELGIADSESRAKIGAEFQARGRVHDFEVTRTTKTGRLLDLALNLDWVTIGGEKYILTTIRDITERKRAEEALSESEEKYRLLADNMLDFVSTSDLTGRITYVSPSIERALGYTFTELQSLPREMYMKPESIEDIDRVMLEEIAKELEDGADPNRYRVLEVEYIRKDGSHLICELKSTSLRDRDGFPIGIQTIGRVITERKQAEESLRISEQNAHQMADSLRMVNEISTKITSGLDLERLLQALYEECQRIGDTDQFYVSLYDELTELLSFPVNYENGERSPIASRPNHKVSGLTEYILEHRQTLHIPDTFDLPPEGALNRKTDDPTRSYIGVPLMIKDRVVGVLSMQSHRPGAYIPDQIHTLELLATQAAIAIHNAQLFEQAQQEINERGLAEEKLRTQTERLDLATRSAEIGIWDWDIQKNQLIWDDRMYALYGMKPGDFGGAYEAWLNGLHPDDREHNDELTSQALRGEREFDTEFRVVWPDGSIHWLKANGQVFWDQDRQPLRMVGVNYDITERKQAEEELRKLNTQLEERVAERTLELHQTNLELEQANRAKDEFLANMSHELRTPLNSILGLSESLMEQRRDPLSDYQQKSLAIVQASGQHLLELINDILDLSKIDAGKFDIYPQVVEVSSLCQSSLTFVKQQAIQKSISLTCQEDITVSKIHADPRRLKQILVNLLTNAVKFTPEHGHVTLQVQADAARSRIQFSVIDTGIGISAESLKRLFQPFVQVDSSLNRQFEGTGLGLALVQKLIDLHGGSVEVESEVGRGSRFTINLPWEKETVVEKEIIELGGEALPIKLPEKTAPPSKEVEVRGIILLAEDNPANTLTIGDYLENHGYQIVFAQDGLEAIQRAEETDPDIILMDIQMPVLDGLEAIRRLRSHSSFTSTPIIALTALAMPGDRERCLQGGANEYMSKPVNLKSLVKLIDDLLRRQNT